MKRSRILYYVTISGRPTDPVQTVDGLLTYEAWLEKEKERIIKKSGWPVEIVRNPANGEIALVHRRLDR
jgi:hypothetical protein